jgi:hypothetical protein
MKSESRALNYNMFTKKLPVGGAPTALNFPHFPTRLQAFVWRNWSLVSLAKMAKVLKCSEKQVLELGVQMGLRPDERKCHIWNKRGYITIIRRNWHLLPYEQILELLNWTAEEMAFTLKEDDFLFHKLGNHKPQVERIVYFELNEWQDAETELFREIIQKHFYLNEDLGELPFDFLDKYEGKNQTEKIKSDFGIKLAYSYSAVYGDPLFESHNNPYPDSLLEEYADNGINAVWLQGTLYTLIPWLGNTEYSKGWEVRLNNLRRLVERAGKYGISVYIYMNEPRNMPEDFFADHPDWKGAESNNNAFAMCTSKPEILEALRNGVARLFQEIPGLGGVFTITMSENVTHCRSHSNNKKTCPVCAERQIAEFPAEVNCAIAEGVHSVNPQADVIAWTWGWDLSWAKQAIAKLPQNVKLMCVSETSVPTKLMGIKGEVLDYSISKVGPGPVAEQLWSKATECGLKTVAKVQLNNTWECSAVPYIPVPYLVKEHLTKLKELGISDLMFSWTLGGYPGGNLELIDKDIETIAKDKFGIAASCILEAWSEFSTAFREFPLHQTAQLYLGPQNFGPTNLLFPKSTGYKATMIGFPYDDLKSWTGGHYPEEIFEEQFRKLSEGWNKGMNLLMKAESKILPDYKADFTDLKNVAEAVYCHFRSSYLQIRFIRMRDAGMREECLPILDEEIELAKRLLKITNQDSRIGFEASNHYYYTFNDLREKVINCEYLKKVYILNESALNIDS